MRKSILLIPFIFIIGCKAEEDFFSPCKEITQVFYEGAVYNTVEIGKQCWLKENLNVGTMIPSHVPMTDNGIIEKYCNHGPDSCNKYGGLYQWDEIMQYDTLEGSQGVCPEGWHIPTDEEWKVLEGTVDSRHGIGDPQWDWYFVERGYDAGQKLKSTAGWTNDGNGDDEYGFSGLAGGYISGTDGDASDTGWGGYWWTSTIDSAGTFCPWNREILCKHPYVFRNSKSKRNGYSVRCVHDL